MLGISARSAKFLLLAFHGQLLAMVIYDLIIQGAVDMYEIHDDKFAYFDTGRIVIGCARLAVSTFSLIIIERNKYRLLFVSAVALTLILSAFVIIYVYYLAKNYHQIQRAVTTTIEFSIKAALLALGSCLSFFLPVYIETLKTAKPSN
jgi:hypothetical protein